MGNGLGNTFEELRQWLEGCPKGTLVPASILLGALGAADGPLAPSSARLSPAARPEGIKGRTGLAGTLADDGNTASWRERLWAADPEVRIGRAELLEAVGRPRSWLYRHTHSKAKNPIPHRKLDGELIFLVGEVREWLREHEKIVRAGLTDGAAARLRVAR